MKLGFFGNINNYPLLVAEALRMRGYEVVLILNRKELLHRPESKDPKYIDAYGDWIYDFSHIDEMDFIKLSFSIHPLLKLLKSCDYLFLNDIGPSLWLLLRIPSVILLTGSDLDHYASYDTVKTRTAMYSEEYLRTLSAMLSICHINALVSRQREGIRNGIIVNYAFPGVFPECDKMLSDIKIKGKRTCLQIASLKEISYSEPSPSDIVRIFSATRLTWRQTTPEVGRSALDYKGADVMVKGIAMFYRETGIKLDVHLVRKGYHVEKTIQLVKEEGIDTLVTWHDEMPLRKVWDFFKNSDILFEQLGECVPTMAGLDALSTGRPLIANTRPDVLTPWSAPDSPVFQATTPEEVCEQLKKLVANKELRIQSGVQGRSFVEKYFSSNYVADVIEESLKNCKWEFNIFKFVPLLSIITFFVMKDVIWPFACRNIKEKMIHVWSRRHSI